jgi:hypothetical protein
VKRSTARSPFPWFGGKQKLADDIIGLFPPHNVYVEVFGGGGSVLLSKTPSTLDVYNDVDDGLVCFFTCLRDEPERLIALLELTPYSRSEWQRCRETWADPTLEPVERARRWYVVASQSFGGMVARGREGWGATLRNASGPAGWKADRHPNGERHHGRGWGGERLGRMHLSAQRRRRTASTTSGGSSSGCGSSRSRTSTGARASTATTTPTRSSTSTRPTFRRRGARVATTTS